MGILSGAMKAGLVGKAAQVVKTQAAKPENQARAKGLVAKVRNRKQGGSAPPPPA